MGNKTPKSHIQKLRTYVYTYQKGAHVIDNGYAKWVVAGTKVQHAAIAKKAILLGFKIQYNQDSVNDIYKSLEISL